MTFRFSLLIAGLVGAYALLAFHLYQIQLVKGDYYTAKAATQVIASQGTNGARGAIYFTDKDGNTLPAALEKDFPIIYAVPAQITDAQEAANTVAPILAMPVSTLEKIFSKTKDQYELLVRKADPSVAQAITSVTTDDKIKGIYADVSPGRFYPLNSIASQLLGYVGPNSSNNGESGYYGIESYYNSTLAGVGDTPAEDITLTIDPNVQIEAEKVLDDLVTVNGATGGSVIVEDPQTGKILAMAGDPSFDPNNYSASAIANFLNTDVQAVYEPGSIFKVLTMAAGIDAGKITPNTTYVDKGIITVSGDKIENYDFPTHGAYGLATMTQVIQHSINTGAVYAESQIGNATFLSYMKKFGLDQVTGVDLPGEVHGSFANLTPKAPQVNYSTVAYGQGVAVTPLELINIISAIANGGTLMRPYVNAALSPQVIRRVVSTSTAEQVTGMMTAAVDLANVATINGYSMAGKTGSAFIPDPVHGGYTNKLIDSYVGFGPTSHPRFVALIRLNTLPSTALAAQSVVPAFRDLSQYLINYYNIPPDRHTGQ